MEAMVRMGKTGLWVLLGITIFNGSCAILDFAAVRLAAAAVAVVAVAAVPAVNLVVVAAEAAAVLAPLMKDGLLPVKKSPMKLVATIISLAMAATAAMAAKVAPVGVVIMEAMVDRVAMEAVASCSLLEVYCL